MTAPLSEAPRTRAWRRGGARPGRDALAPCGVVVAAAMLLLSSCAGMTRDGARESEITVAPSGGSAAINKALEECGRDGGVVKLTEGTYVCIAPIILRHSNLTLQGAGNGTVLRLADGAGCPVVIMGDEAEKPRRRVSRVRVAGLRIDGNRTKQKSECWNGQCDTGGATVIRSSGIVIRHAKDAVVEDVTIVNCRSGGLVTEKHCSGLKVRRLTASGHEFDALACYETTDSVFEELRFHDNKAAGISTDIDFNGNVIRGAVMERNGTHGFFMRDSRDNTIEKVTIRDSGSDAVFLAQVDEQPGTEASGNKFEDLTVTGTRGAAFRVASSECRGNVLGRHQFSRNKEGLSEATPGLVRVTQAR